MNPEWTEQEKEDFLREMIERELWEEQCVLLEKEFAGEEQCSCCKQSVRCELQFENDGNCERYQEIPYYD